jgi:hypothetical protein
VSSISSLFRRPLLIYDDKCYSCTKFARLAETLSRGWIRIAGHYYSQQASEAKNVVFPAGYDSTKMFWLINRSGAYGARSGLLRVAKEIAYGIFASRQRVDRSGPAIACEYDGQGMSCFTPTNVLRRIARLLSHGATIRF